MEICIMREPISINQIPHKIGAHGLAYYKPNGEWIRSTKSVESIELAYSARDKRIADSKA